MSTKADLVNGAYEEIRISGLTAQPGPEDVRFALDLLEDMMASFFKKGIDVGYNFQDLPDPADKHNIPREHRRAIILDLAWNVLTAFGKEIPQSLLLRKRAFHSTLVSATATPRQIPYPSRQPIGSGNQKYGEQHSRYYHQSDPAPNLASTNRMFIGDVDNFVEHFDAYLDDGESIQSFTI
jgi:hypothetical protein